MSFILEALNKSREPVSSVPTLSTQHPVERVATSPRQYILWAVCALALVIVAWVVWGRLTAQPEPIPESGSPVAELTQNIGNAAASVTTELRARAEARTQDAQSTQQAAVRPEPESVNVASPAQPGEQAPEAAPPDQPAVQAAVPVEPAATTPRATEDPAVARLYRDRSLPAQPAAVASEREEEPLDIKNVLKRAQEEMGNSGADDHPVPLLTSLSQQAKNDIPTVYYQRHDYSSNKALSEVTLNGKTVKTGGSPGSGFKVEEILPDSVVLSYRGTQFRLRALNSWVNL